MNQTAIVTIVSNNYLHFARTLMQSVAQQHPEADRYCVNVDRDAAPMAALQGEFTPLPLASLDLPEGDDFLFQYTVLELNTAVKPWALAHLAARGYANIIYIDPDILLYRPLTEVFAALASGAELVLTPHLLAPVTDDCNPAELDIRRAGTYNLGFCALRNGQHTRALLSWWQAKLLRNCIIAHDDGIFVDQSWMDLVPGLFPAVHVLRHPGYNVAYWNLAQRPVTAAADGSILIAGEPLIFFHYSGLNPLAPQPFSKYQNRFTLETVGPLVAGLISDYCQRVMANGIDQYRQLPYGFGCFDDGTPITDDDRTRFRTSAALRGLALGKPFAARQLLSEGTHDNAETELLSRIYAHFLDRQADRSARDAFLAVGAGPWRTLRTILGVALSAESRAMPGWLARLLAWPFAGALFHRAAAAPLKGSAVASQSPRLPTSLPPVRPAPFDGLYPPEPDSAAQGLWVGPRLNLPVCAISAGKLQISGQVDLRLLARGRRRGPFYLDICGPQGLLGRASIADSGAFSIDVDMPPESFAAGSEWCINASAHVVPKEAGLSEDTRALAWRVRRIELDGCCLIDSARSPVTRAVEDLVPAGGINLIGYLAAELGLGEAARSLARACLAAKIPFSAVDVGFQSQNLQRDTALLGHAVSQRFPVDLLYVNADQTAATARHLESQGRRGRYRIGYWHWEQPRLPASALGAFAHVDEVWVPSTFVHDAVAPYAPVPVVKIPHALEIITTPGLTRAQFGLPADQLLALVMYDFHSYQYRKNPQAAIAAFRQAAAGHNNVALVIKTINGHHHAQARQVLQDAVSDLPNVIFIDEFFTRQQTWDLQACCDILLSLHRAEGFGLAPAEMMYLGKPVIATGWSANMDFMTPENSFPVRYTLEPLAEAVGVYPAGQLWAEADIEHAAWCLGRLIEDSTLRAEMGKRAAQTVRTQLAPQAVGQQIRNRLSLLGFWNASLR